MKLIDKVKDTIKLYGISYNENPYATKHKLLNLTAHICKPPFNVIRIYSEWGLIVIDQDDVISGDKNTLAAVNKVLKSLDKTITLEFTDLNKKWRETV